MKCRIRKFDATLMKPGRITLIIGKRGTGKSILLNDLLYSGKDLYDFPMAMSPTAESANNFRKCMPHANVFDRYVPFKVDSLVHFAKECSASKNGRRFLLCLDDCMYDKKAFRGVSMREIHMNGRHHNITLFNAMQYVMDISPDLRSQIDYVFALKENIISNRVKLWKYFFGMFQSFDDFCLVLDKCTQNYECLVLDNTVNSTSIHDCIYWYRATPVNDKDFRLGKPVFYTLTDHMKRENEIYGESEEEEKKGKSKIQIEKES